MTDTTVTTLAGWVVVVLPDGVALPDAESDDYDTPAVFTRTDADAKAAEVTEWNGLPIAGVKVMRAGDYTAPRIPNVLRVANFDPEELAEDYPAPRPREMREYVLLLPDGSLYVDGIDEERNRPHTSFATEEDAAEAAEMWVDNARERAMHNYGVRILSRSHITTVTDWHIA